MQRIGAMRIVAAIIDGLIIGIAVGIVQFIIRMVLGIGYAGILISGIVGTVMVLGYFYLEVLKGQAIGKQIFKFQITAQDGSPATKEQLTKRYLIKMSATILGILVPIVSFSAILVMLVNAVVGILGLVVLVFALMMLRANKLAYYDELANTAVYGPGTMQAGFPVMPGQATTTTSAPPPPPTA
jgi:uncharacterized RDD family membrane protein YckC